MRKSFLPYCKPAVDASDIAAVGEALANGWLTSGPKVRQFETAFAAKAGVAHAVALNSCTAGLHLGMIALGVTAGDDVVMPALSFVAAAQCARHLGARPVFADIDPVTYCSTAACFERALTPRTKLILSMGYAGRPAGIADIVALGRARGIAVLEDAALAVGTLDGGLWAGHSAPAAYSFYATKNLQTAEGGMFLTSDAALAERIRLLSLHGMDRDAWKRYEQRGTWRYDVVAEGHKYNMPDLAAALGLAQLQRIDALQTRRHHIAAHYTAALARIPGVTPAAAENLGAGGVHSWAFYPVSVERERAGVSRDAFIEALRDRNIGTSVHYIPTDRFTAFADLPPTDLAVTHELADRLISLPLYPGMSDADCDDVVAALAEIASDRAPIAV